MHEQYKNGIRQTMYYSIKPIQEVRTHALYCMCTGFKLEVLMVTGLYI